MSKTGSVKARRSSARLAAVQVLYQMQLNHQDAKTALREFVDHHTNVDVDGDTFVTPDEDLLPRIVEGTETRWIDVDAIVSKALADGGKTKVDALLDCTLRAGVYELLAHGDVDTGVIINDYLNVTTAFYEGKETKLVNAILDRAAKSIRD